MTMYERIKSLRTAAGLSQDELARMVGYTDRSTIAKIERGVIDLTQSKISALAKALGTTSSMLMWGNDHAVQERIAGLSEENKGKVLAFVEELIRKEEQ